MAVSAAMQGIGSVLGLVLGGALTVISWRLAFLINVPIGIVIIAIAVLRIGETQHERLKLDVTGALLATLGCTVAVLVFTQGPPRGWVDPWVIGAGVAAVVFFVAFLIVERTAEHPLVPFSVFDNRNRVMTFVSLFLAGGVLLTADGDDRPPGAGRARLLRAAGGDLLHPVRGRLRGRQRGGRALAPRIAPRWLIIGGGIFVLAAMLYGSTLTRGIPYFPDLFMPIVVGGFGIGMIAVILPLCAVAEVGPGEIGPVSAITLMVQNLGGPVVLVVIQAVQTSRTLYLGGTTGPVKDMTPASSTRSATATPTRCCGLPASRSSSVSRRSGSASPPGRSPPRNTPARRGGGRAVTVPASGVGEGYPTACLRIARRTNPAQ